MATFEGPYTLKKATWNNFFLSLVNFFRFLGYMFASHPFGYYINLLHSLNIPVPLIFLMKFGLGAATSFHVLNGIRHLVSKFYRFTKFTSPYFCWK